MPIDVKRFSELFQGYDKAYGRYVVTKNNIPGQKNIGKVKTTPETVTTAVWEDHLHGEKGIGIVPINGESKCRWACIDIDVYSGLSHVDLIIKIRKAELPLIVCRTKSGGAHCFLFLKEDTDCQIVVKKMVEIRAYLGYAASEVFPKQTIRKEQVMGSWLNLPYCDAKETVRYAFNDEGDKIMDLDTFLNYADSKKVSITELNVEGLNKSGEDFNGAPPCIQHLVTTGFPEGVRNNGITALAVFAKKAHPNNWEEVVEEYNRKYLDPHLPSSEVLNVIKSIDTNEYNYKCSDQPLAAHCNRGLCLTRQHGIGGSGAMPLLKSLVKVETEPTLWFLTIEASSGDKVIELSTEELQDSRKFQRRCMEVLTIMPPTYKSGPWQRLISELIKNAHIETMPEDTSIQYRLVELINAYFSKDIPQGRNADDLLTHKAWYNEEDKHIYFSFEKLCQYIELKRIRSVGLHKIANLLRELNAVNVQQTVQGRRLRLRKMPWNPDVPIELPEPKQLEETKDVF